MNKLLKYHFFFSISAMVVFTSCGKDSSCFKGTGEIVEEQREFSSQVTNIVTEDNINIVLTQSKDAHLSIEGGKNLLPYIETQVEGKVLSIFNKNKCGLFRDNTIPITVHLSIPNLSKIDYTGQGTISNTGMLNLETLDIESYGGTGSINLTMNVEKFTVGQHSGPADFNFSGSAKEVRVYTLGSGWFHMGNFVTENTHVNHSGIGNVIVNAINHLSIELRSRGNVSYLGNPTVIIQPHVGSGVVKKEK